MTPRSQNHHGRHLLGAVVAVAMVALAACGGTDDTTAGTDGAEAEGTDAASGMDDEGTGSVAVAESELGATLVDDEGLSLYLFEPDQAGPSTCYEGCAQVWPPVQGPVEAGTEVDASLLGTTEREDGTLQATYAGWTLYHYASADTPGEIGGQGVEDVWWLLSPDGEPIRMDPGGDGGAGAVPGY